MRHALEASKPIRDRDIVDPGLPRSGRSRSCVFAVVCPRETRFGGKLVDGGELDPASRARDRGKPLGTSATSSAVWFSKIRSFTVL